MIRCALIVTTLMLLPLYVDAQQVSGGGVPAFRTVFSSYTVSSNGADTTEDTLKTFDLPAGTLANVGDRLHIVAAGQLGATTDSKVVRLKFGGTTMSSQTSASAGQTGWRAEFDLYKTGASTQRWNGQFVNTSAAVGTYNSGTVTDTAAITILVSGQNSTNSVANSINCQTLVVDYVPAVGP